MNKKIRYFIVKNIFFLLLFFVLMLSWYLLLYRADLKQNNVYVWGDSQMYQGFNLDTFSFQNHKKVVSTSQIGSGVYDFSFFCNKIQDKSTVIISFPTFAFLRTKAHDRNWGISFTALWSLIKNNYTFGEIFKILKQNILAKNIFHTEFGTNPNADTIVYAQSIDLFKFLLKESDKYFDDKKNIYFEGIDLLIKKKCTIYIVEYPLNPELQSLLEANVVNSKLQELKKRIKVKYNFNDTTIYLPNHKNAMYDLTHLNKRGQSFATLEIIKYYRQNKKNSLLVFKLK